MWMYLVTLNCTVKHGSDSVFYIMWLLPWEKKKHLKKASFTVPTSLCGVVGSTHVPIHRATLPNHLEAYGIRNGVVCGGGLFTWNEWTILLSKHFTFQRVIWVENCRIHDILWLWSACPQTCEKMLILLITRERQIRVIMRLHFTSYLTGRMDAITKTE